MTPATLDTREPTDDDIAAMLRPAENPRSRPATAYPPAMAFVAAGGTAAAVIALAWLSVANHALVPFLSGVDLGIHEFGHMVMFLGPWVLTALAGSLFQVAVPLALGGYFLFARRQPVAAALCVAWAASSARNVAVYIGDAPYQRLELWGGDGVLHDWAQILAGRPMQYAGALATGVEVMAWMLFAAALALAVAPVVAGVLSATRARAEARAFEARRTSLQVREPHGPIG
jgi:hypothetical protein